MSSEFDTIVTRLPGWLAELIAAPAATVKSHGIAIPNTPGVYLFAEHDRDLYVGQSRTLRSRLQTHVRMSGTRDQASFAWLLAMDEASPRLRALPRLAREADVECAPLFAAAKLRVAAMPVRFIEIDGPIERTLFEVYAALGLATTHNSFETH